MSPYASLLAIVLAGSLAQLASAQTAGKSVQRAAYDVQAERELLDLANQERADAKLSPLQFSDCLTRAARQHADTMAAHAEISHQFSGELALEQRLAANCNIPLDQAAENVAVAASASGAHESFMHSPSHRENLLHPSYNVAGFAVAPRGSQLYVVQDFGHRLPSHSAQQAGELVAKALNRMRDDASLPRLEPRDGTAAQSEACALAQADSLRPPSPAKPGQARYILRFTSMQPENLPAAVSKTLSDRAVRAFAAGACFARTASYPSGAYWVVLEIY